MIELERKRILEFTAPVVEIRKETPTTNTLVFDITGQDFEFYPGQYIMLKVPYPKTGEELKRAYSIASSPLSKDRLEITVKRKEGGKASVLLTTEVKEGDSFSIKGPYGKFYWVPEMSNRIVLLGAGSGVVPLMCMLRYIRDASLHNVRAKLLVSYTTYEEIIYREELQELSKLSNIEVNVTLTRGAPQGWNGLEGRINRDMILQKVEDIHTNLYYLCGPPKFVNDMKDTLLELGVERSSIKTEKYD